MSESDYKHPSVDATKEGVEKVEILEWNDNYSSGLDNIDGQHKYLFQAINDLGESINKNKGIDELMEILTLLVDYTGIHFKFVESCMNRFKCPVADKNKVEHDKFLTVIQRFQKDLRLKEPDKEMLYKVHNTAVNWIKNHIMRIDTHLRSCTSTPGAIEDGKNVTGAH